uniref:LysM domain-containing protein n=1 Tax=Hemiselmis andersenii TaxID=464988 RepID=A0A7S1HLK0_HEMAN|mmetsp:Transcript_6797/g.16512  ORF Transcript_6797/g.16512 Transcript_6797/m.16512 type:complete len:947 (+) Transcript_6797:22-2862(+)
MRAYGWLLLATLLLLEPSTHVSGQYLKYGTLKWRQIDEDPTPLTGGITVHFTLYTAWRRDFFNRNPAGTPYGGCLSCTGGSSLQVDCGDQTAPCVLPNVGDTVEIFDSVDISTATVPLVATVFSFGEDPLFDYVGRRDRADIPKFTPMCRQVASELGSKCIKGRVVEAYPNTTSWPMPEEDATSTVYVVTELTHKYPYATASYPARFQGCCRMDSGDFMLHNNPAGPWDIQTTVSVTASRQALETGTAASPYFAHVPTVNVIKGRPMQFKVHAFDIADRPITYQIGSEADHGVGLKQDAQRPFGNTNIGMTIDAGTGMVVFPATASTVYERYYNLVVLASVVGPCHSYDTSTVPKTCLDEMGLVVTATIRTTVDFYIQVVDAGYVGLWPVNDCLANTAGLPIGSGSKVCNKHPVIQAPTGLQRFLCGEPNSFTVTANDGDGTDQPSVSVPAGYFAIRHRRQLVLPTSYNASFAPAFPRGDGDCCVRVVAGLNATDQSVIQARGAYTWAPTCERLETDNLYSFQGRHRLDQYAVCFTAVDSGAFSQWQGQLVAPPACTSIAVLRCTKPTIRMVWSDGQTSTNGSVFTVPVATGVGFKLEAEDDYQTRTLGIFHRADPGVPSTGSLWGPAVCLQNLTAPSGPVTCNPLTRHFNFTAGLEHAGIDYPVCFEATNDQIECPPFRPDSGVVPYGTWHGPGVTPSQASQPLCITLNIPGPTIQWIDPTPLAEETLTTYMGCLFAITLIAQDASNYFDLDIVPFTNEFGLPTGVLVEERTCSFVGGASPSLVAEGVGSCPKATRIVRWSPSRSQTGLVSRVCFNARAKSVHVAERCFSVLVSKCRYCAQAGESLMAIAESFQTDWLQLWGANAHLHNPHKLSEWQLINLGALYPAHTGDTLQSLATRFRSDVTASLAVNPDFESLDQVLVDGQPVCMLPGICRTAEYRPPRAT